MSWLSCITCQSPLGQYKPYGRYRNRHRIHQPPASKERKRESNNSELCISLRPTFIRLICSMYLKKSSNSNILLSSFSISPARTGVISCFRPLRVGGCCVHVGRGRVCVGGGCCVHVGRGRVCVGEDVVCMWGGEGYVGEEDVVCMWGGEGCVWGRMLCACEEGKDMWGRMLCACEEGKDMWGRMSHTHTHTRTHTHIPPPPTHTHTLTVTAARHQGVFCCSGSCRSARAASHWSYLSSSERWSCT